MKYILGIGYCQVPDKLTAFGNWILSSPLQIDGDGINGSGYTSPRNAVYSKSTHS